MTVLDETVPLAQEDRGELLAAAAAAFGHHFPLAATKERDGNDPLDRAAWVALCADLDPVGMALPVSLGGSGMGVAHLAVAAQASGALVAPTPFAVEAGTVAPLLADVAPELLPALLAGREVVTFVGDGQALASWGNEADAALRLTPRGDELVVSRVTAATVTAHRVVDRSRPLATWQGGATEELGAVSSATWSLIRSRGLVLAAAEAVGTARAALDRAVSYVALREQFGRPVGSFQAVQQRAADLHGETESAAAAVERAAQVVDRGEVEPSRRAALVAFVRSVDAAQVVARESLHLHGGIGFTWEHDAHLFLKRALADAHLHGGRAELLLELADLLGS